jgi:hypothetical protein
LLAHDADLGPEAERNAAHGDEKAVDRPAEIKHLLAI